MDDATGVESLSGRIHEALLNAMHPGQILLL